MQPRVGGQPAGTQASHTLFMSSTVRMSESQMVARRSLVLSVPAQGALKEHLSAPDDHCWAFDVLPTNAVNVFLSSMLASRAASRF
jgi:hypothetical protein